MKPEAAKKSDFADFLHPALMIVLVDACCLGMWLVIHDRLIVFATLFAALAVIVIMRRKGRAKIWFRAPGVSGAAENRS
jgi:heme/copper-type cytochrome/quinol oxidase subunit 3